MQTRLARSSKLWKLDDGYRLYHTLLCVTLRFYITNEMSASGTGCPTEWGTLCHLTLPSDSVDLHEAMHLEFLLSSSSDPEHQDWTSLGQTFSEVSSNSELSKSSIPWNGMSKMGSRNSRDTVVGGTHKAW